MNAFTNADLKAFRLQTGYNQAELATLMGLSLRAYQDIENGVSALRAIHWLAVERVSLGLAVARGDISIALPLARRDALDFAALVRGEGDGSASQVRDRL